MYVPRPSLLVIVPLDWEAVPGGLQELKRHLSEEYGASLLVQPVTASMVAPLPLFIGSWEPGEDKAAGYDVFHLLPKAFFTLQWMEEVL